MTPSDLSPAMRKAYDALSQEDQAALLKEQENLHGSLICASIAQIQARNNSHNVGNHVRVRK
jgi:hypothetical protein